MNIKPVVFLDLDDTIFQTARKMPSLDDAVPATCNQRGEPASWMTPKQDNFFLWLRRTCQIIPVTGRSVEQLARTRLPFTSWKIACHGAVLLDQADEKDPQWDREIRKTLQPFQERLAAIRAFAENFYLERGIDAHARLECVNGLGIYVVMKHANGEKLAELHSILAYLKLCPASENFQIYANDNNLSVIPAGIDKGRAINEIMTRLPRRHETPVLGFGDSLSDLPFLKLCDMWGTPRGSQIDKTIGMP